MSIGVRIIRVVLGGNQGNLGGNSMGEIFSLWRSHEPCFSYVGQNSLTW